MRQRCHAAPGSVAPIAATSPACASLVTSDPRQAAGGQRPQEPQPAGAVLGGGDVDAQDLPIPVGVDSDRDQGVHVDHPAPFANLEHQGVGGQEGVRAGIERAGAKRLDSVVEFLGHHRHLRLGQTGTTMTAKTALATTKRLQITTTETHAVMVASQYKRSASTQ